MVLGCYKWFEIYSIYEIWFSIQMNRKVPKKRFCIPKQATIADRGYEVFTQETSRSSPRPGGSQKKEVRSKDPGEIISDLSLVFLSSFDSFCCCFLMKLFIVMLCFVFSLWLWYSRRVWWFVGKAWSIASKDISGQQFAICV